MVETITKMDSKGRIIIPKSIRKKIELKEGSYVSVNVEGNNIIIRLMEPVADKFYGVFKVNRWPVDMDNFLVEAINKWWTAQST